MISRIHIRDGNIVSDGKLVWTRNLSGRETGLKFAFRHVNKTCFSTKPTWFSPPQRIFLRSSTYENSKGENSAKKGGKRDKVKAEGQKNGSFLPLSPYFPSFNFSISKFSQKAAEERT